MMKNIPGMVLYEGPSLLTSAEIVVIAVPDKNPKTNKMLFTYVLDAKTRPSTAAYNGDDKSVCGDCIFRAILDAEPVNGLPPRPCYVRLSQDELGDHPGADEKYSPDEVWDEWKMGGLLSYKNYWTHAEGTYLGTFGEDWGATDNLSENYLQYYGPLPVRIGSYGDPAAVPTRVWAELVRYKKHWTMYTHNWRTCDQRLKRFSMASVDSPKERDEAQALGWRTFYVVPDGARDRAYAVDPLWSSKDILCPATDPHPKRNAACATCLLCRGTSANAPSIWEVAHGPAQKMHTWSTEEEDGVTKEAPGWEFNTEGAD